MIIRMWDKREIGILKISKHSVDCTQCVLMHKMFTRIANIYPIYEGEQQLYNELSIGKFNIFSESWKYTILNPTPYNCYISYKIARCMKFEENISGVK